MARFLTLDEVADELATSRAQVYALVRSGDLPAIKLGGRGQWRVERRGLEEWLERQHRETAGGGGAHPWLVGGGMLDEGQLGSGGA